MYWRREIHVADLLAMVSYSAAGTSYGKFLKAFNFQNAKGFFSYEWYDYCPS